MHADVSLQEAFASETPYQGGAAYTFPLGDESYQTLEWVVIKNPLDLWKVTSYDTVFGYNNGTYSVFYRLGHWKSEISGFTTWPNPQDITKPLTLVWKETNVTKQIDPGYRSGYIRVQGSLMLGLSQFRTGDNKIPLSAY